MRQLVATVVLLSAAAVPGQAFVPAPRPVSPQTRYSVRDVGFEGTWVAEMVAPGNHARVVLEIYGDAASTAGRAAEELLQATVDGVQLHLQLTAPAASFDGAINPEGARIVGRWTQDGEESWLVFRRL
jgi:hypothetical protein